MIDIKILTDNSDISIACELYWETDDESNFVHKVAEIAKLVGTNQKNLLNLVKKNCIVTETEWLCKECGKPYQFRNRTEFNENSHLIGENVSFVCSDCNIARRKAEEEEKKKQEELAMQAKRTAEKELKNEIRSLYDLENREPIDVKSLSLTDLVYLLSILRGGAYENLSKIMPPTMFERPIAPNEKFVSEILNYLHSKNLLYVHPDSTVDAFVEGKAERFYIWKVSYAPPISQSNPSDPKSLVTDILNFMNDDWQDNWYLEAYNLWKRVALEECIEYLLFSLDEHHFDFSPGEKTIQYIEHALENFSTAQVFNIIWRSAKNAAAYYQRENISKRQAANSAVSSIQRFSERALAEGWELKAYRRNFKCPQTIISETLYNAVLKIGDEGFNFPPNMESLKNRKSG